MTDKEIAETVEGWNWNLSIFEIYDEVKDMGKFGYNGSQTEDLSRLLNHAYEYFNYDSTIAELMSFLGVEIDEYEDPVCEPIPISDEGIRLDGEKGLTEAS